MAFDSNLLIQKDFIDKIKTPKLSQRSFYLLSRCVDSINKCSKKDKFKEVLHHIISTTNKIYELDGYSKAIEVQDWLTSNLTLIKDHKVSIPNVIHFIWFGEINHDHVNYMQIWANANTKSDINLWYDSKCFLSHEFHEILKMNCKQRGIKSYECSLLKIQNEAYNFIKTYTEINVSFDEACIRFLVEKDFCDESLIRQNLITIKNDFEKHCCKINKIDFRKVIDKESNTIKEIYELEMYLRGNLAAASDIARLVILRQYGGLYVDVDTLPVSEGIFNETYGYEGENDFNLNKIVDALKMEVVLSELHGRG
ncbi:TcdA/TcdB catalytic glycosyltransferase domain-containing protein, partial [Vibrio anguillarum]